LRFHSHERMKDEEPRGRHKLSIPPAAVVMEFRICITTYAYKRARIRCEDKKSVWILHQLASFKIDYK